MRVVFFDEIVHQLRSVLREIHRAQIAPEREMAFDQRPFGERAEMTLEVEGEDRLTNVEQVDAAAEFARALLGRAMCAFGDDADDALIAAEEREDLTGLAELDLAKANAAIGRERHIGIIGGEGRFCVSAELRD